MIEDAILTILLMSFGDLHLFFIDMRKEILHCGR